jgi:hypothetical protein
MFLLGLYLPGYAQGLNVSQRAAGANMSVDVNVSSLGWGGGLVATSANFPYFGWIDAAANTSVSTSDPSNARIDTVVAYVDLSLISSSTTNNSGAFKVKAVAGTAAGSPTAPNGAAIQSSIGAGNPYIILGDVAVAAAASSVVNANITDRRTPMAFRVPYLYGGSSNTKGHLVPNQADGTMVTTTDTNSVSAAMLATNALTLGYAQITGDVTTASLTVVAAAGLSASVTIPSGGRKVKITVWSYGVFNGTVTDGTSISIWDGTVGSGTQLATSNIFPNSGGIIQVPVTVMAVVTPSAGAKTYNVGFNAVTGGTSNLRATAASPAFILVELI